MHRFKRRALVTTQKLDAPNPRTFVGTGKAEEIAQLARAHAADLVIFDYDKLQDTATYSNSNSITEGIDYVFVGGEIVYQDKQFTGKYPGKMLRHNA